MASASTSVHNYFLSVGKPKRFSRGDTIVHAYATPLEVLLVSDGVVKAYSIDKTGNEHIHAFFGPGKCLPVMRTLAGLTNHICCVAMGDVTAYAVPVSQFLAQIEDDADFTRDLLRQTVAQFALFTNRIENLEYTSAKERLIYRLLTLAGSLGHRKGNMVDLMFPLSHEDLAHSIQVSREVVTRQLRVLRNKQLITYTRQKIRLYPSRLLAELRDPSLSLEMFGL